MNQQNLRKLIAHIEANKKDFQQYNSKQCIVGTTASLSGSRVTTDEGRLRAAQTFLDTTRAQVNTFYASSSWPEPFKARYEVAEGNEEEANVALDYLRSFLEPSEEISDDETLHELGGGLTFDQEVLVLKRDKAVVSIPLTLSQIRKLHLALGKVVWENS